MSFFDHCTDFDLCVLCVRMHCWWVCCSHVRLFLSSISSIDIHTLFLLVCFCIFLSPPSHTPSIPSPLSHTHTFYSSPSLSFSLYLTSSFSPSLSLISPQSKSQLHSTCEKNSDNNSRRKFHHKHSSETISVI